MFLTLLRPKYWAGHLAMILCLAAALALGLWQYDAWHQRRLDAARNIADTAPVALSTVMTGDSPFPGLSLGQPVTFSGTWMGGSTVYISDRFLHGRRGYWAVTPVRVDGSASAMPVVRGWVPRPAAPEPSGPVRVTGWLQASESDGTADLNPADDIIPTMRIASLVEHVNADLYSGYVVQRSASGASTGVEPVTPDAIPPVSGFTALRNLLYAIEWWLFGGFAVFIWVRWCRDTVELLLHPERAPA